MIAMAAALSWMLAAPPPATVFAFASTEGDRLLAWDEVASPKDLTHAICGTRDVAVKWVGHQEGTPGWDGRQVAREFDQNAGEVFRPETPVAAEEVCLLASEAFVRGWKRQAVSAASGDCDTAIRAKVLQAKRRAVTGCWNMAAVGQRRLVMAQFVPWGKHLLASMAMFGSGPIVFQDYPADLDETRTSCWRVDDGCEFAPQSIRVLFAYVTATGVPGLAVEWGAFESQSLRLIEAHGPRFDEKLQSSRYWSP